MSSRKLEALHNILVDELLKRLRSGDATAADLSVARGLLKDNGIEATNRGKKPLVELADEVPFEVAAGE